MSVNDMWKLASVGYDSQMSGSEQIPPMDLLVEKNTSAGSVLGVSSEKKLKEYVQDVLNGTKSTGKSKSGSVSSSSDNSSSTAASEAAK
ncbi:hypothetical protein D3C73_338560 [compost metagenome]